MGFVYLIIAIALNTVANIFIKIGSGNLHLITEHGLVVGLIKNYVIIIGVSLFAINIVFYTLALSKINLSIAYPIMSSGGFLIITLVSYFYFKEAITPIQIVGILVLIAGIVLIAGKF